MYCFKRFRNYFSKIIFCLLLKLNNLSFSLTILLFFSIIHYIIFISFSGIRKKIQKEIKYTLTGIKLKFKNVYIVKETGNLSLYYTLDVTLLLVL